ncbi:heme oxygenase-like protein, partial [Saccharata proteae CBS 121410]
TRVSVLFRTGHIHLNRLITSRLPLALPPHAASPRLYASGLSHFAHVYLTFESCWRDVVVAATSAPLRNPALSSLLEDPWIAVSASPANSTVLPPNPSPNPQLLPLLASLVPSGLARSRRLRSDLATILSLRPVDLDVQLSAFPGPAVRTFCEHIRRIVRAKPHVLVAYTWVLYMAVFSGGRYIRAELAKAGEGFWGRHMNGEDARDGAVLKDVGLGFWGFEGECDGDDVKADYKARLAVVDAALTPEERVDVVEEARNIFENCRLLVEELDALMDTPVQQPERVAAVAKDEAERPIDHESVVYLSPTVSPARSWLRNSTIAGAVVVLGSVYWLAASSLRTALQEGWQEGWHEGFAIAGIV